MGKLTVTAVQIIQGRSNYSGKLFRVGVKTRIVQDNYSVSE